jgi:uncharacterized protein
MAAIGKVNNLQVLRSVDFGLYLDAGELDSILLPVRYVPKGAKVGDWLDVFIYLDSEDRLICTTETPRVMVGQCANLKVVSTTPIGAFVDWGLSKDLLIPFGEQVVPMTVDQSYPVFAFLDPRTKRITGSTKIARHLSEVALYLAPEQPVEFLIYQRTDLGYMGVIENRCLGLLFHQDILQPIDIGQRLKGFVKEIRHDNKVTLSLQLQGQEARDELSQQILDDLKTNDGTSALTDKSTPDAIYKKFSASKASYKRALGALYKQRLITIEKDKVTLL